MKINFLKISSFLAIMLMLWSCAENDFTLPEDNCIEPSWVKNKEVAEIVSLTNTAVASQYAGNDYIEAYVTSNDERGNFFKSIHLQTIPTDNSNPIGIVVSVDKESLYGNKYTPGRKVIISLKDIWYAKVDGSLKLGSLFNTNEVGRIKESDITKFLAPSCASKVNEDTFVRTMTMATAINDANLNTLIELDNVQFADGSLNRTMYDINSGGFATNHTLIDKTTGASVVLRVSSFAQFASNKIPTGYGKVRGVLTKFGTTYQFMIREFADLKLTNPRTYNFSGVYTENFESYANNTTVLPKYVNLPVLGTKSWITKTNSGLKYIEMSSFGGNVEKNRSLFMVPVDFTAANNFSFQLRTQFYNGACLKVYYTKDYVPGTSINNATLYDITSAFTIPTATISAFANAGTYAIPSNVSGNGFFVFEYTGSSLTSGPVVTTTMQIDNIVIN